jgi:hypothetical protein
MVTVIPATSAATSATSVHLVTFMIFFMPSQ